MITPEEKEARAGARKAAAIANLSAPRTGYRPEMLRPSAEAAPSLSTQGLELSELQTKPANWFKPNPANTVFDRLKTPSYWDALKRDIREARAIINPIIALQDGTILEGHSRVKVARELLDEGLDLGRLPVLLVASHITPEEAERRVYLGNLSRFEIDEDTRLALYVKVWPEYYLTESSNRGRPKNTDTVSDFSTAKSVARATGQSTRQVERDRATVRAAQVLAKAEGKGAPEAAHIRKVRAEANTERRRSSVRTESRAKTTQRSVVLKLTAEELEALYAAAEEHWSAKLIGSVYQSLRAKICVVHENCSLDPGHNLRA
jgi:hypothetical protein